MKNFYTDCAYQKTIESFAEWNWNWKSVAESIEAIKEIIWRRKE